MIGEILVYIGAGLFGLLGSLHLLYTARDITGKPRYFRPSNKDLLPDLKNTKTALARHGRSYWAGLMGFHLSHSMALLMFCLLIVTAQSEAILWLRPVLVAIGGAYAIIAWRCWFSIPMIGALIGTGLILLGWFLEAL
jgi:hypothetical protein